MTVRVLIVDDHEPVRRGIRSLLTRRADWLVCGEAADGVEATELARKLRPEVILMDMSMPRMSGVEATRIIRQEVPEAEVIIVSQNDPVVIRHQAAQIGARGCVSKATLARDLLPAILEIVGKSEAQGAELAPAREPSEKNWLFGGGDLGHLIRQHDWSATALGPIWDWPQSLRTTVNLMLNSQHPIWIGWGPEMTFLYNDAYISVLSLAKHPGSLGRPARQVWAEIWDVCGPLADKVFAKAEASFANDVRLFMSRGEYVEETYYSFSYSPIYDESGKVGGLFCPSTETTARVLHARRLHTLSELSVRALTEKSIEAACLSCVETISQNPDDIPVSLLYLVDSQGDFATLQGASNLPKGLDRVSPSTIPLRGTGSRAQLWPIRETIETSQSRLVSLKGVNSLPLGLANEPLSEALVLPVTLPGQLRPAGVLIAGVNPTRKLDREYGTFFSLIADQVAIAIQNATALEQERKRADALAEIDRAKTVFFSNVSHEFRTPLTLMLGPLEDLLSEAGGMTAEQRGRLDIAHRNSLRLLKLVNTLLDFSRFEAGRMQASCEPTDLASMTAELASVFRSAIERAGLELVVHCPPLGEPVYVDREMWEKIVLNLLSNAFKFTFEGKIEVSLRTKGALAELAVRDTGTGIPAEELPHLFERFHRVKSARGRTFEGSGIGLALVQELAQIHGGTVHVESEAGRGSTFTVAVPFGTKHLRAERVSTQRDRTPAESRRRVYMQEAEHWLLSDASAAQDLPAAPSFTPKDHEVVPTGSKPSILLVEDNADMRAYVKRLLAVKYEVEAVGDGGAALEAARHRHPDLVLTDVMLPKFDGFALLRELRADETLRNIPIILLTARASEESRLEGFQAGADDYLTKPFTARELLTRVATHIRIAQVRRESAEREARTQFAAHREIERRDESLRLAQAAARIGTWEWDPTNRATVLSPELHRLFGTDPNDPQHIEKWYSRVDPGELPTVRELIEQGFKAGDMDFEYRYLHPELGPRWFYCKGRRLRDESSMFGVVLDVTERKKTEEALRDSEQRLRAIVETTPDCVKLVAADGTLLHMNGVGLAMVEAGRADMIVGKSVYDLIAPQDRERFRAFNEGICQGKKGSLEFDIVGLKGARRHVETHAAPLQQPEGSFIHLGITRDITQRKLADCATALLAAIVSSSDDAIVSKDLNGMITSWNTGAERIFGYTAEEAVHQHIGLIIPPDRRQEETDILARLRRGERIDHFETIRRRKDGTLLNVSVTISPVKDPTGRVTGASKVARDITERKRAEEALRQSEDRLRALSEQLDSEVRARTRELEERNADLIRQSERLRELSWRLLRTQDEERRHIARELHDSAGQTLAVLGMNLSTIVQIAMEKAPDLVQSARETQELVQQLTKEIRTTSYLLHPPLLDENGLPAALSWYIRGLTERSGLDITFNISEEFGRLPRGVELVIFRLVQECLTNVHRHSESKSPAIQILREPDRILVEVRDHGKGIPPEKLAEIQSSGSGVGISGMRERLRQFHGEMIIQSTTSGTTVLVTIPVSKEEPGIAQGAPTNFEAAL
jgi:PAS domain S-box-containing protein